jgi:hydroxymethylglutaryl-CoA synthase
MAPDAAARPRVGIEKIDAYPGALALDLEDLARARDHDPADLRDNLLVRRRSLNPIWEDPVTMAVNAARGMLGDDDRQRVELLIVATESSVDQGKAIATWAHRFLQIQPNCRLFEAKQACYGATSALMMAAHWLMAGTSPGAKALVIATDQSRMNIYEPYEYVNGAGAVAMLVSLEPRVLELELSTAGYWSVEAADTFRPTSMVEMGNGEQSLYCYLDALEGAFEHYRRKSGEAFSDLDSHFQKHLYHVPFGGITFQAHRTLLRHWKRMKKSEAWEHFARKSLPALTYNRQVGAVYSGSTFLALMGLLDACDDLQPGQRVGIYSYGSGSIGEFYSGLVCPEARETVAAAGLARRVQERQEVSVAEYEALERERHNRIDCGTYRPYLGGLDGLYERAYEGQGRLVLRGVQDHFREYGWS